MATRLLELGPKSVFIDVAAASSPLPEITRRVFGCRSFAQDIMYAPGVRAHEIGGDACAMPVEAGFADAAALTCSLEHFEGDADIRLFTELARVLRPGGRIVVAPLYLNPFAAALTDPRFALAADDLRFDADAVIHCADGWGNRHGRFYSPETLQSRILRPHGDAFDFRVFRVGEPLAAGHTDHSVYLRFALLGVRR
ncbi:MAG: methyltransferase domain-containing protein [Acidobacteria bacterium]|nr:methyltransferase domain-containing protein [Acidobacteriota bacterium]